MSQRAMLVAVVGVLMLGTGCPHTYRKGGKLDRAMQKDREEEFKRRREDSRNQEIEEYEEEEERICPDDKVEYRDCRTLPCTVTCQ